MRHDSRQFNGRHALITGSTSGIGLGIAMALAEQGCHLTLNGLGDGDDIARRCREMAQDHLVEVEYSPADMRRPDEIADMVAEAEKRFGGLDILINNAGIQHVSAIHDFPIDKWDDIIAINLSSAFHTIRAALSGMLARERGRIINMASAHALVASPYKAAYVAAKHGLAGLTKTVALEVAEHGITVNAIAPGYVQTPLVEGQITDTAKARGISEEAVVRDVMLLAQPTRKLITIDEVAELAVYLCSDAAASITGAIIPIDGGWTAR